MMKPSKTFTSPVMGAWAVDPKLLEKLSLLSWDAFVVAINEVIPDPPPCVDDFAMCPGLVPDDGSSQSSNSLPSTPQSYVYPSPRHVRIGSHSPYPTTTFVPPPNRSSARVLVEAQCAGGKPVKQKDGTYTCPSCDEVFQRRDDAKRHIDSKGMRLLCKYCGKPSGRRDSRHRHLKSGACQKAWEAGYKAGRFTEHSVEDAYN